MEQNHFEWFEESGCRALCASVGRDGKLRLGKALLERLPPFIRVGFDAQAQVLALADGRGSGLKRPACGVVTVRALAARLDAAGLRLPVSFRFVWEGNAGHFVGPAARRTGSDGRGKVLDFARGRAL